MPTSAAHATFQALARTVRDRDFEGFVDLFEETGVIEYPFPLPGLPPRLVGRRAIRDALGPLWRRAEQSGRQVHGYDKVILHDSTDPEVLIAEFEMYGEVRGTGAPYRVPYIQVLQVRDGKVLLFRDYLNPAALTTLPREEPPAASGS